MPHLRDETGLGEGGRHPLPVPRPGSAGTPRRLHETPGREGDHRGRRAKRPHRGGDRVLPAREDIRPSPGHLLRGIGPRLRRGDPRGRDPGLLGVLRPDRPEPPVERARRALQEPVSRAVCSRRRLDREEGVPPPARPGSGYPGAPRGSSPAGRAVPPAPPCSEAGHCQ